jgi:signal transduction histidine kinase
VVRIFAAQAKEKGVVLESRVSDAGTVVGDETKLTWALSNLLANALRYTPSGGTIAIEATARDQEVDISVHDSGPGIPPGQQERVFERYAQSAQAGDIGGAIVRDIVQAHGGRILLDSAPGKGTRFTLELPRC